MIIYLSLIPLLFLPTESSSIRDRNFRNDLVPLLSSRLDSSKKDPNSLKIVSNEPFIIQLQVPNSGESARKAGKEKDAKWKRPTKKRISKLKPIRKRHRKRRDLQSPKIDLERGRKSEKLEVSKTERVTEHQSENATKNPVTRAEILMALSSYKNKREMKKGKKDGNNFQKDEETRSEYVSNKTPDGNVQHLPPPLVKMVYPNTPKSNKHLHKYTYKDLMSDRERLEKKIKYIKNMMNMSSADDAVRVRRRSESDRTANKIAKMFLTLSAVNGLHDKRKSKCEENDNDEDGYHFWEKENQEYPIKRSSSSNEERYKVKKWIEHMKNKRSSSKTCPCMQERDEERDVFPLEQKLPKNYYLLQKSGGSEESSEVYEDPLFIHRDKSSKHNLSKRRNQKAREDQENKLKALAGKGKKLDLPLDDLELYRAKAKQILQNAEEILDKIKEDEEKRLLSPNILVNQLKELTSRIQTDPRNNENDFIRKIQKTLGLGSTPKSSDGPDGSSFLENVKSFILDPYEKAKALTDESTKKLSSYLLRNLGDLQESDEMKENADNKGDLEVYFGQVPRKEEDKPLPASLAKEKPDNYQSKVKESPVSYADTVSSAMADRDENKKKEDSNSQQEDQFKKRVEEIIREQEKKLNGYVEKSDSEESSKEFPERIGNRKEEQGENETAEPEETLKEVETSVPLQLKKDEINNNSESTHNYETQDKSESIQDSAPKESDYVLKKEVSQVEGKEEASLPNVGPDENEDRVESEIAPDLQESNFKEGEKKSGTNKEYAPVKSGEMKSNDQKEVQEVVAAVIPEEQETDFREVDPKSGSDYGFLTDESSEILQSGTEEKTEAKKPEYTTEDKSFEETVSLGREELEVEPNPKNNSLGSVNPETPDPEAPETKENVDLNDPKRNNDDDFQKKTDQNIQMEANEREVESQTATEHPDLLKEAEANESLEKMKPNEEKDTEEKNEEEETLQLETPAEGHTQGENDTGKENTNDETSDEDQLSEAALNNGDQEGLTGGTVQKENSNEGFDVSKKEDSDNQKEQNMNDDSPVVSATSSEQSDEIPSTQRSDEDSNESSQSIKKPKEVAPDANEDGTLLKPTNEEVGETQYFGEDSSPLKATANEQVNEKDGNKNVDEKVLEKTVTSEEVVSEKLEDSEGGNEALLQSDLNKSLESNKDAEEVDLKTVGEDHDIKDEESEDKPILGKSDFDANGEDLKGRGSNELLSGEQKEESFEEGKNLKVMGSTDELNRETQNLDDGIGGDNTKEDKSDDGSVIEREDKGTLSSALGGQDPANVKEKSEEIPSETSGETGKQDENNTSKNVIKDEEILKATLKEKDRKNIDENDKENSSQAEEFDEELKKTQDNLKDKTDDKDKEVEMGLDNQTTESEDTDDEISLKTTNEEVFATNLNGNEEDKVSLQRTLDNKDVKAMKQIDDDEEKKREDDDVVEDDALMKSLKSAEDTDETPLRMMLSDKDLENGEENQGKSEGINDDISLGVKVNKDNDKFLESGKSPQKAISNENEGILEDTNKSPLKTTGSSDGLKTDKDEISEDADDSPVKAVKDDKEISEDVDESSLKAIRNKDEEILEDVDESSPKETGSNDDEKTDGADESPVKAVRNKDDEEEAEDVDESSLKAIRNKDEEILEDVDKSPPKDTGSNDDEKTDDEILEDAEETPVKAVRNKDDEENAEDVDDVMQSPVKATGSNDDEEILEDINETPLKATRNNDDEEISDDPDESPLRTVNIDSGLDDKVGNSNKAGQKTLDTVGAMEESVGVGRDDPELLKAKNHEKVHQRNGALDGENPLRPENLEELNNNIYDGNETPLREATDDFNHSQSLESINKDGSEESLGRGNFPSDINNQIGGQNEDGTSLISFKSFDGRQEKPEEGYETLEKEDPSENSQEWQGQDLDTEDKSPLVPEDPVRQTNYQRNPKEEIPSENLQASHPQSHPLKANAFKVPTSIAKIMKDLEGKEKGDISTIENLNPEKIDYIIDKIDEVEQQNKVTNEEDCRKECACAEDINLRSRNIGRYEIAKDFLRWMKDLQLNRVLSDY